MSTGPQQKFGFRDTSANLPDDQLDDRVVSKEPRVRINHPRMQARPPRAAQPPGSQQLAPLELAQTQAPDDMLAPPNSSDVEALPKAGKRPAVLDTVVAPSIHPTVLDGDLVDQLDLATADVLSQPRAGDVRSEPGRFRLLIGKQIPGTRYRILGWLGEGGMGVVYEAEHIDIERKVALKVLRADLSRKPLMAEIFRNEARTASRIGSPYIVEVYDFGELPDGRLFFCMERITGHDLSSERRDAALDVATCIGYLRMICKGLGAAHRAGIVHRDIKPENILVTQVDNRDKIKILDFGIAAFSGATGQQSTVSGGTPQYMAPEQIAQLPCDGRLDMYALGVTAYELLTRRLPFESMVVEEVLQQHLVQDPPSFAEAAPDDHIAESIENVIMRCLAKHPDDRYRDMDDLEAALCEAQIAAGITTPFDDLALPDVEPDRRARLAELMPSPLLVRSRRTLWPIVLAIAATAAVAVWLLRTPQTTTSTALAQVERLASEAQAAGAKTFYVYPPPDSPTSATSYLKVLELEALGEDAEQAADDRALELRRQFAATLVALGNKYWDLEAARGWAYEYYTQALLFDPDNSTATSRNILSPTALAVVAQKAKNRSFTTEELGYTNIINILAQADADAKQSQLQELLADPAAPTMRASLAARAVTLTTGQAPVLLEQRPELPSGKSERDTVGRANQTAKPSQTTASSETSVTRSDKIAKLSVDKSKADDLRHEADDASRRGRRAEAERLYHQALSFDTHNARALTGLSDVYFQQGKYEEMVRYAQKAVQASPRTSTYRLKLGDAYFKLLRYREALVEYKVARDLNDPAAADRIAKVHSKIGTP